LIIVIDNQSIFLIGEANNKNTHSKAFNLQAYPSLQIINCMLASTATKYCVLSDCCYKFFQQKCILLYCYYT